MARTVKPISMKKARKKKEEKLTEESIEVEFHYFSRTDPRASVWDRWWQNILQASLIDISQSEEGRLDVA